MKKVMVILFLMLLMTLCIGSFAMAADIVDWDALIASGDAAATESMVTDLALAAEDGGVTVLPDWGKVFSDIMTGAATALVLFLCTTIVYVILRIVIPLLPVLVQWLKDKNILWMAKILVTAAESALGRFVGSQKFEQVVAWFEKRHITVTDEVKQMIYNAWWQLNNQMINMGLKEDPARETGGSTSDPFEGSDAPISIEET
ncbi:MAG TPA: hypothetical protein PKU80_03110 [Candidatus Limiplasma sp.]|nr:hypothetical protein [Candidatus Limiplasma sp.]